MAKGNIDQLDFEVILNDEDFNKRIKADMDAAKKFNISLSKILEIQNKLGTKQIISKKGVENAHEMNRVLTEIKSKMDSLPSSVKIVESSTKKTADEEKRHGDNVRSTNSALSGTVDLMHSLTQLTGVYFGAAGVRRFVSSLVEVTGNLEMQREAMNHILGSAEKGQVVFEQLKELAKPSYFTLPDLTKYAKQLSALSIPYEELFETTKMLGDVSAGLGVSFDRIALAYGHIRSMGFLRGMQARQLTNAGIPIFEELAKNLSEVEGKMVSISDVYDRMSKRQITFEQVKEVFVQMTSEGGKFYDMQIAMTDTLAGRINKLKGVWEIALSDLGNANGGVLKSTVNTMIKMVEHLDKIGAVLKPVITAFGTYYATLLLVSSIQKAIGIGELAVKFISLTKSVNLAKDATEAFGSTLKAASFGIGALSLIGVGIYEWVIKPMREANEEAQKGSKIISDYMGTVKQEKGELKDLMAQLEKTTAGTREYNEVKNEILRKYDKYLTAVDKEKLAVGELAGVYDSLAASIENVARAEAMSSVDNFKNEQIKKARDYVDKNLKGFGLTEEEKVAAASYIFGATETLDDAIRKKLTKQTVEYDRFGNELHRLTDYADQFRTAYGNMVTAAVESSKKLYDALNPKQDGIIGPERLMDFQQVVLKRLQKVSDEELRKRLTMLYSYVDEKDWDAYADAIGKKYDDLNKRLARAFTEERRKPILQEINFLKQLNADFGGALLSGNKTAKKEDSAAEKERKQRIAAAKAEIADLRKYMEVYESFAALVGEDAAKAVFGGLPAFKGRGITDFDFAGQIKAQLEVLDGLGDDARQAADSIRASMGLGEGKDLQKQLTQAQKAAAAYRELVRFWSAEDTDIEGKGFWHDISKVASDLETKLGSLAVKGQKAKERLSGIDTSDGTQKAAILKYFTDNGLSEQEAQAFWDTWVAGGVAAIDRLVKEGSDKARAKAAESARDLAKTYVQDFYTDNSIDLTNLAHKSLVQLGKLKKELGGLSAGLGVSDRTKGLLWDRFIDIDRLPDLADGFSSLEDVFRDLEASGTPLSDAEKGTLKLMHAVQKAGGSFDDFRTSVDNAVKKGLNKLTEEEKKSLLSLGKVAADNIMQVASALGELAEATGDEGLAGAVAAIQDIGDIAGSVIQGFQQGGWVGAAIAGVSSIATKLIQAETEAAKLQRAIAEAAEEVRVANFEKALAEGVDTLFGENMMRNLRNAVDGIREAKEAIADFKKETEDRQQRYGWADGVENYDFRTSNPWFSSNTYKSLAGFAEEIGMDLYDEYGNISAELIDKIFEKFGEKLTSGDKDFLTALKNNSEMYRKAVKRLASVIEATWHDLADNMADSLIDAYERMGDAGYDLAANMESTFSDMARDIAKSMISSFIIYNVLSKYKDRLEDLYKMMGDPDAAEGDIVRMFAELAEDISGDARIAADYSNRLLDALKQTGVDLSKDSDGSVGLGVQSITEDTANLLASYVNATRADVAAIRSQDAAGWRDVAALREAVPTLNDYLAQCAANTYDIARSNAEMLSELRSVIGSPGSGGRVVRVYME